MTAREVVRALTRLGAVEVRQKGSHRRYVSACGKCATTVAMHAGDIPKGTLRSIERAMEPCYGKGWLLG
jgi:predicted RNA binding protein YcfA (HicA-like mRNA interferase family)